MDSSASLFRALQSHYVLFTVYSKVAQLGQGEHVPV